jgi:hypothetical protein
MSISAAGPAGFSYLSPCLVEPANKSLPTDNGGDGLCSTYGGHACSNRTAIAADFRSRYADENSSGTCLPFTYPVFRSVTASGPFRRPAAVGPLLRIPRPFGVSVPPKTSLRTTAKGAAQTSLGLSEKADLRPWEPGPLAWLRPV